MRQINLISLLNKEWGGGYFVDATVGEGSLLNRAGSGMIKWSESVGETAKMP